MSFMVFLRRFKSFHFFLNKCRIPSDSIIKLYASSAPRAVEPNEWQKQVVPIKSFAFHHGAISIIFVYGVDYPRPRNSFIGTRFWESFSFWILFVAFFVGTIVLFSLRRRTGVERVSFSYCMFEMYCSVIGNGNIRTRNGWEKLYFSGVLATAFLFVSIYLTDYSMHSLLLKNLKVDTFEELAKHNVPFYMTTVLSEHKEHINYMLR